MAQLVDRGAGETLVLQCIVVAGRQTMLMGEAQTMMGGGSGDDDGGRLRRLTMGETPTKDTATDWILWGWVRSVVKREQSYIQFYNIIVLPISRST